MGNAPRIAVSAIELAPAAAILEPRRSEPPLPEVLVAADDVRAFNDLLVSVRERRFEATFDDTPVATPWATTHLTLAPINIEPLDQPATNNN
ncbi:MAG: hypothetical protein EHM55_16720 [Acidobacteria bacterium]|nr:MAG: hypothetical protein EHM55_16720 [Acidobacteriota bacterium]